ncbi:MAG: hypothetical protein K8T25_04150 [Planctomycetia bacterium]|nr:hypothetical protein [Planctomycetia bacterium]
MQGGAATAADRRSGQRSMFDELGDDEVEQAAVDALPDLPEWDERQRLSGEKEVLGYYLSSHPLAEHEETLRTWCSHTTGGLADVPTRNEVIMGGILAAIKLSNVKQPRPGSTQTRYAMFDLEDTEGIVRCIAWPEQYGTFAELIVSDAILGVRGAVDRRAGSDEVNLIVNELMPLAEMAKRYTRGVRIRFDETRHPAKKLDELHEILRLYHGTCAVELLLCLADGSKVHCECDKLRVDLNPEMRRRVDELLGPGNFRALASPPPAAPKPDRQQNRKQQYVRT